MDGVWLYFVNKNIKKTGLNNFIDVKKNLLGAKIERLSKGRILYGPYSETKIINSYGWSNIDFAAKYLGTYESHIQEKIIFLSKKFKLNNFIDLGAAEGYHIISLLKKKYFSRGSAFEINIKSRNLLKRNATINGVSKKLSIFSDATFESLKKTLKKQDLKKMLFLVDIEGHEFKIFDKNSVIIFLNAILLLKIIILIYLIIKFYLIFTKLLKKISC